MEKNLNVLKKLTNIMFDLFELNKIEIIQISIHEMNLPKNHAKLISKEFDDRNVFLDNGIDNKFKQSLKKGFYLPFFVEPDSLYRFKLTEGHHRFEAIKNYYKTIPCIIIEDRNKRKLIQKIYLPLIDLITENAKICEDNNIFWHDDRLLGVPN